MALADERKRVKELEARVDELARSDAKRTSSGVLSGSVPDSATSGAAAGGYSRFLSGLRTTAGRWGLHTGESACDAPVARRASVGADDAGQPVEMTDTHLMSELATAKVALAEMEGQLSEAKRDAARVRDELAAAQQAQGELSEERDKAWEEVGSLMVQLHVLQNKNAELQERCEGMLAADGGDVAMLEAHGGRDAAAEQDQDATVTVAAGGGEGADKAAGVAAAVAQQPIQSGA